MSSIHFHYDNLHKHDLYPEEVEEAIFDPDSVVIGGHSSTIILLGRTLSGRLLEVGYRENSDGVSIYVFHAMPAKKGQSALYGKG